MLLSNIPAKIAAIFAASGTKNTIPLTTAGVAHPNNASFDVGFPPLTMTPVISGGLPPFGADFNGLLNDVTAIQQWQSAGGLFPYDSAFSTSIGGYPKGAMLLMATGLGIWQSTADSNTSNPDTGGANWVQLVNLSQFAASLAASGYIKIPVLSGGVLKNFILQAGVASVTTGGTIVTFPITFPASVMGVFTSQNNSQGQATSATSISTSGFTFGTSVNSNDFWFAIGY